MVISVLIIASIIIIFAEFVFPLSNEQRWIMYIFDLIVTIILIIDFVKRLSTSSKKSSFLISHWYEYPAMVPLIVYGMVDSTAIVESTIGTVRFLALFRLARLYNIALMIRGSEILLLSTLAIVSVIFGTIGIYIVESPDPHANIRSLYNAFWWSIETMTTIAYGEYYPVTASGRIIATFLMLAGIGILWSVVATVTSKLVELKLKKEKNTTIMVEVKSSIKDKIDNVEKLSPEEINDLIRLIRSLNSKDRY